MKKLLLLLLFAVTANAQFLPSYPTISQCDDNNDQYAVFDLTQLTSQILAAVVESNYTITYYPSYANALNNTNPIINANNYSNIQPAIQTLGIRIVNNSTNDVNVATVDIRVLPRPTVNSAILQFCDTNELPIYNLNDAIPQIINGDPSVTITFYETIADAETGSNAILDGGYIPLISPGIQILYARVENTQNACFSVTTLTLNTYNCGEACPAPSNLMATNITPTSFTLNWSNSGGFIGYIFNRISIVPYGAPPPTEDNSIVVQAPLNSYIFTGLLPDACYSVYVRKVCDIGVNSPWSEPLTICMLDCVNSGNCAEALILNAFLDSNNNGIKDTGEFNFNQGNFVYQINDSGNNLYGSSNNGSYYIYENNPLNSYDINFAVNSELTNYYVSNASYTNVTLPDGSGANYLYFPITTNQSYIDAVCYVYPQNQPRPGFTYDVVVSYTNNSFGTISNGTLTFTKDPNVTIVSISQTGTTASSTGFTYDFTNLAYNEIRYITVTLQVPTIPTVNLGDLLTNSASIQVDGDANLANNSSSFTLTVVGSYDPNDKAESRGGKIVFDHFTANDYLYYTIRFENTGTANAEFIRVEDVLHADLDENTFEMLNASHTVNTRREGNQLTWHFFDINLPPSSININDGHGYVYFRIKPKAGYAIGDIIPNTASIFFDYNPAIVTNRFDTEFVESLGIPTFEANNIILYPNPASELVTVNLSNVAENLKEIVFYDIIGKKIKTISSLSDNQTTIDLSDLSKGVYLVEINTENNFKTVKKLVIQ
ncbi:DUF7619 domain-containing protein [Flavobacterium sp. UBA7682]|uniref:DUF7619 domain-containing protein n=1 Tax=Flavobacterium sp. UBA7682 TaxID=1946560 RepID=UPI0025C63EDB|nr:T9SS type A sorting domain-containing protein [Flavobacterium sp. UBA7682]